MLNSSVPDSSRPDEPTEHRFSPSPQPTLGIEEEYQLCDPETGALMPAANRLIESAPEDLRRVLSYDLIQGLIEVNSGVSGSVADGMADIAGRRREVQALAEAHGLTLGITGTHPFADPDKTEFVKTDAYRWVRNQLHYVARRNITFGMHVHVGVDDAERAIYVANRLRAWIGPLIALAANSPFLDDRDTGWDSARSFAFGMFPRSGGSAPARRAGNTTRVRLRRCSERRASSPRGTSGGTFVPTPATARWKCAPVTCRRRCAAQPRLSR